MENQYTAVIKQDGDWWIGWIEAVPGVYCQEAPRDDLLETLRVTLQEALALNTPRFRQLLEKADERITQTGGVPEDEFWQLVENTTEKESHGPSTDAE